MKKYKVKERVSAWKTLYMHAFGPQEKAANVTGIDLVLNSWFRVGKVVCLKIYNLKFSGRLSKKNFRKEMKFLEFSL